MKEFITDEMWERIEFLFPEHRIGGPRKWEDRVMLEAMLYILNTGCRWESLPESYPPKSTVFDRFKLWVKSKLFQRVLRALRMQLPQASVYYLDATIKSAKKGDKISRAGKIKGSKISLITHERGWPVRLAVAKAGRHDLYACSTIYYSIPKKSIIICDRGYDGKWFRQKLRRIGLKVIIPKRQMKKNAKKRVRFPMLYKGRWICERTFSWLEKCRKLSIRYERHSSHYEAFWNLACFFKLFSAFTG